MNDYWNPWHPKTNMAESFHLMVACGIDVSQCEEDVIAQSDWIVCTVLGHQTQSYMQAIFQCAVAIGRRIETDHE